MKEVLRMTRFQTLFINIVSMILTGIFLISSGYAQSTNANIIFLHHSTGGNLYNEGGVADWFTTYNTTHGTNYQITERWYPDSPYPDGENYPYDYWHLWVDPTYNNHPDSGRESLNYLTQDTAGHQAYDGIIFKHCFPGSEILEDIGAPDVSSNRKSLENYRLQYRALRNKFAEYPTTKFIVWTLVPLHRLATDATQAARAKQFADWVKNDWLTEDGLDHPNIYVFDFWGYAAESHPNPANGQVNTLRYEFEGDHNDSDSHPNTLANQTIAPYFSQFVVDAIRDSGGCSGAPDATRPSIPWKSIADTTPTYTWNTIGCATWYQLWVNGPSGTVINQWYSASQANCVGGNCSVTPSTTLTSGNYTWWVRTWNSYGYGPWSAGKTFTVSLPPLATSLILPSGTIGDTTPPYIWSAVSSATWYYLWVNGPSGNVLKQWYSSAQANCGGGACAVTPTTTLAAGNYTWWVQTWNSGGYGPWSAGMSLTVSGCTPGKTVLIAPSGSATNPPPWYWWYDVGNATWYYLWVNGPSGNVIQQWYTSVQANCNGKWCWVTNSTILPTGTNTWWIQTWNSCGYGPWSAGKSFTISGSGSQAVGAVVTVRKQGSGSGTILSGEQVCGLECGELTLPYTAGAQFTLQVIPAADSRFVGWQTADGEVVEGTVFYAQPGETVIAIFEKKK
jgi:hypothetical protein